MILRACIVWLLIAVAEVGHGILRVRFLNPRVGDRRARQIGVFTGSALLLAIAVIAAPWLALPTAGAAWGVGALWFVLMLLFEILFGRLVFRASWQRIAADFDFRRGGWLAIGMAILFLAPFLAAKIRGLL
ncbi:MAG: hypothetical protein HZA31_09225 [Opitutae bacterium]|nr:hypothetical protein [Opitutae bacterium]